MEPTGVIRRLAAGLAVGVTFFVVLTYVLGFPETLSYPDWFVRYADDDMIVSEFLWSLISFVPTIMIVAFVLGYFLAKFIGKSHFSIGCLAVGVALFLGILKATPELGLLRATRITVAPNSWIDIPAYLALYLALPLASFFFGRRASAT